MFYIKIIIVILKLMLNQKILFNQVIVEINKIKLHVKLNYKKIVGMKIIFKNNVIIVKFNS